MVSTSTIKLLNNHLFKPLCFSSYSSFDAFSALALSLSQHSRGFSSLNFGSFMEIVREVAKQGSDGREGIAIRADQKSYGYKELISSALSISSLLCGTELSSEAGKRLTPSGSINGVKEHGDLGGARIGIVAKPSAEFLAGMLGTWLSSGVAVPLALSYPEAELLHVMNDSDISMILSTEDHQELMQSIASKTDAQFSLIPHVPNGHSQEARDDLQAAKIDIDRILHNIDNSNENPALIIYTSGTTGKPKGVVHTHKTISAQVRTLAEAWEYMPADQFLHCLPLHHVHGLFNALLAPIYAGSTVEFLPKFSVRSVWQRWRESYPAHGTKPGDSITVFTGVPTMYTRLIQGYEAMDPEQKKASAAAAKQLRLMMCGSSALPLPVMQQWEVITGHRLLERYGMTEFVMSISNPLKGERKPGTVGKPFPGVETRILSEDGSTNDAAEQGELCIRCPSLFKEYWRRPEATKEVFTDDGFFKTGDAAKVDEDGYYIILGRTSADIMKVGGYKLSALEIESVLLEHPTVQECCVLGLPDNAYGEAITAIIVPEDGAKKRRDEESKPAISLEELRSWAQEKLAPYKLPTRLFLWDSIPRNAMGKVNKKELKKTLAAQQDI